MQRLTALALLLFLLLASPVLAQKADQLDSDSQVSGYGHFFAYVLGAVAALVVLLVGIHIIKGMIAEHSRGKKLSPFREDILDKLPKKKQQELFIGEKVPDWKTDNRKKATRAALKFLSATDKWFGKKHITTIVNVAFRQVKAALETRSSKLIQPLVTAECLAELQSEIKRLREKGNLHVFGQLEVTGVEIVHIEVPAGKRNHTFTALISARSKDYFVDEKTKELLRGDKKLYSYQEFWRFRRTKVRWLVERIRPADDMDRVLEPKNVLAQSELAKFAKEADPEYLREFVGK